MFKMIIASLLLMVCFGTFASRMPVEYTEIDTINPRTNKPLKLSVWYPKGKKCDAGKLCLAQEAKLNQGIILTHGAMGSARELNWLGFATASQGFVTVGVNHYGESWVYGQSDIDPTVVLKLWERSREVSSTLDILSANALPRDEEEALFNQNINWHNVTAIGFSSGGSTVISLSGGVYQPENALSYCASAKSEGDLGCQYSKDKVFDKELFEGASELMLDERVKLAIAFDPAAGHIMNVDSLKNITLPILIVGAKQNDFLPFDNHAAFYDENIPLSTLVTLNNGEGHFVFIDSCEHDYKAMGLSLCKDRDGVNRDDTHNRLYADIFKFIYINQHVMK